MILQRHCLEFIVSYSLRRKCFATAVLITLGKELTLCLSGLPPAYRDPSVLNKKVVELAPRQLALLQILPREDSP